MSALKRLIVKYLKEVTQKIEAGTCDLTEEEAMSILSIVANESLSKDQACSFLNMSRSKFDSLVQEGVLPKGKKVRGFKELRWYKNDLMINQIKKRPCPKV